MTVVTMYRDKDRQYTGFKIMGHSGYADAGADIICSAVSVLAINTINSIESFVTDVYSYEEDEALGYMKFLLKSTNHDTQLLLKSLVLGLSTIQKQYKSKYLKVEFEEV